MQALQNSQKGHRIILQWSPCDIFINACNQDILHLWRGNIDLWYVEDEYSTIMYVCSYMMKSEKAMGEALTRVAKEYQNGDIWTQMNKIKKELLGKRVVGAPESAMQVLSMGLMRKSRNITSVNTNMKDEHVSLPKTQQQLAQMDDDDDNDYATSTIDRYAARPPILGNMYLATFAVNYTLAQANHDFIEMQETDANELNETEEYDSWTKITLKDGLGYMQKRKWEAILCVTRYKLTNRDTKVLSFKINPIISLEK